jgi:hypothetical protein
LGIQGIVTDIPQIFEANLYSRIYLKLHDEFDIIDPSLFTEYDISLAPADIT